MFLTGAMAHTVNATALTNSVNQNHGRCYTLRNAKDGNSTKALQIEPNCSEFFQMCVGARVCFLPFVVIEIVKHFCFCFRF